MLGKEVKGWLAEYKGLSSAELNTFASTLSVRDTLIEELFVLFETPPFCLQELDPVCHQLFEFYRSGEQKLKLFSLQFVSALVWLYLRCLCMSDKKVCSGVETFLLGVYNLEIVKTDGSPLVETFCIPSVSKASIYHESRIPGVTEPLTEHALRSLNPSQSVWRCGPFLQYERFNAQNRFSILSFVMQRYNIHIDSFHNYALSFVCKAARGLSSTGLDTGQDLDDSHSPRIAVSPSLLVEYMVAVYFAMFNGHHKIALRAVEATHKLASYELYSDVLLITNAILHSHRRGNLKFEATEVSIGTQKTAIAFKNSITNASFKAKKLPDDIDFVEEDESPRLATVDEDQEHSLAKGLKAKLMNIGGKLGVDKNRNRDTVRRDSDTPSLKSGSGAEIGDTVGVAVRNSSGGGKVVIDMLELQPIRGKGNDDSGGGGDGAGGNRNSYGEKGGEGKQVKISSSPIGFSKKSGVIQQTSHGASGLVNANSLAYTASSQSSSLSLSPPQSVSSLSNAVNGKSISGNSSTNNIRQPSLQTRSNPPGSHHSPRAHSEGPILDVAKLTSLKQPPSSSPSLLTSQSFPNNEDSILHANLSEPELIQHSSSSSQLPSSVSSSSIPADIFTNSTNKTSHKPLVSQNSCSTNL